MSGCITAITPQKKNSNRCSIFIDSAYAFSVSEKIASALRVGEHITDSQIKRLKAEDEPEYAFSRALHYLKYRPRSKKEIREYLEKKRFSEAGIANVLKRLENYRYVDDEQFARLWIENRSRHRPRGEFALRYELIQKGIEETIIDRMLSGFHEKEPAWRAVLPRLKQWEGLDPVNLKKKIYDHLRRRGFSFQTCQDVFEEAVKHLGIR
ncbi:MAG: RecX family transcriptional regulator [Desulfobacterales bacterium]